tara:strand:+ start:434 stop:2377 length:1944 start_codon:yes stop_codon:yes gene_type:complete
VRENSIAVIKNLDFRKDINLLRALSVLAVVFYHIDKNLLPGGWLGVDIFFFISGYLISNKIIVELNNNKFKFKNFYLKRIKRIIPPVFSTIIFSLPFAFVLLPPKELFLYLSSIQSTVLFYSNIFFQNLDFYNSPSSKFFPMLHMWSLSIEEQFYIVFPVLIFIIFRYKKNKTLEILALLVIFSVILNFIDYGNATFYQLQFRIWEFLFGILFMLLEKKIKLPVGAKYLGLFIILFSLVFFDDGMINQFYTKAICLIGVFLYLAKSKEDVFLNKLKNNKALQQIGLISFSLYLLHQPIFVFYRIYDERITNLSEAIYLLLILALFLFSYLNWKFVEIPFQYRFTNNKKIVLSISFLIILGSTYTLLNDDSLISRYTNLPSKALLLTIKNQDVISKNGISCENRSIQNTCEFRIPGASRDVYVLGDSSLRTISKDLQTKQVEGNYNLIHIGGNDCLFLLDSKLSDESCPNKNISELNALVRKIENSIIIYGGRFPRYLSGKGFNNSYYQEENNIVVTENFEEKLKNTLFYLSSNNNDLILLYPIPEQGWNVPELYFYNKFEWGETISYPSVVWQERVLPSNKLLDSVFSENIYRVYPDRIFCENLVQGECVGALGEKIFYSDDDHLSIEGARLVTEIIFNNIEKLKNK